MPNVVILSAEFPPGPGGIGTHAFQVAGRLAEHDWRVRVAAVQELADEDRIAAFGRTVPYELIRLRQPPTGPAKLAYRAAMLAKIIREERPDLILVTGERMVWIASLTAPVLRVPYVAMGHAHEFNVPASWRRTVNRTSYNRAHAVVCVSDYTASRMHALGVVPRESAVIPNGADESQFGPVPPAEALAFRRARGLEGARLLVTVGSVHERKGQDVVIRALPAIRERIPEIHYVVAGSPFRADAFGALARELGVADRVHFLGVVDQREIMRALCAADLFVMTSQHTPDGDYEGYGIAVVEAALCGRAAVVSDNSGVMEAIEPGETGLVARISDPASTAEQIIELLGDPDRLARMGVLARERALASKTWRHRGAAYDAFFRQLLES